MLAKDFVNHNTYLWGTGFEGQAVIKWWNENIPSQQLKIIENDTIPDDAEIVIKSPGVSIYLPQFQQAESNGVKFTSLMNIFLANLKQQKNQPKIIAITGTKGKSTTTSLLAFMLEKLGYKVGLGGNIGVSPLDFLGKDLDFIVLELSSFQICGLEHSIDYGAIVNISQAHVDWHQTLHNYVNDKLQITKIVKNLIVNALDDNLNKLENVSFYNDKNGFYVKNKQVFDKDNKIEIPPLQIRGEHNLSNLCAVLSILRKVGVNYNKAIPLLSDFQALPHRLQQVYQKDGFTFIDDSIATVPDSTIAAINSFDEDIAVIVGGFDNKPNFTKLDEFLTNNEKVKVALCLPDTGALFKSPKAIHIQNMQQAMENAIKKLEKGGVVLLSPAAPSYNLYKNYKERGYDFARIAKEVL